jgi:Chromo (CHRromatin Organisation MOdifier) domain
MATTPTKNDDLHAAESHDPESASRHKKIATKSVLTASPSAYLASFSSKLAKAEGGDTAGVSLKPVHSKAEDSGTHKTSGDIAANDSNDVDIFDDDDEEVVPPVRSLRPTPTKTNKKVVGSSSKKKTIGKLKLQKRAPIKIKKTPATKKVDAKLNGFWEIERIVDVRKSGSSYEYLVKWKGDYENTWEPQKNLNSSALQEAKELRQEHELRESRASN